MQLCFYLIKLSQNIFVGRKYKKKNTTEKIPIYYTEKNSSFVDVFLEKIYKLFSRKRKILAMQARIINIILQFRYLVF